MTRTRRQLLGAVGTGLVAALAGCGGGGGGQVRDVQLDNNDGDTYTMTVSVSDGSGSTLESSTSTIEPFSESTLAEMIPEDPPDGSVVVEVTVEAIGVKTRRIEDVTAVSTITARITKAEELNIVVE